MPPSLPKKLFARELTGQFRFRKRDGLWKPFSKIPGRMCYRLKYLVPPSVLEEGYVFLGFSKSGQFVLSYSLQIDADEHTAYPDHVYRLQWWHFVPCKRLQLISEVPLFGEENICHSLFIAFCEWPEDTTKVTVYGHSTPPTGDDGCQCYLTVTAVPSLGGCHDCLMRSHVVACVPSIQQCFRHSFCVHSKFELAPPFPFFSPRVQLRVDGIVILNTGDSIVALQVDTQLPLNSFDTEGRLAMEEDEVQSTSCASARGLEKIILGSDLSILGTVSTYFTEQEDPTQDQELSPKHHRHSTDSPLLITGVEEGEEENVYSADISELSDTDQSESKSTRSSCDRARSSICEKCCGNNYGPNNGSISGGNPNSIGVPKPGSICGCVSSHRPALRAKNLSNSNTANSNDSPSLTPAAVVATTAALLKSNSNLFHASHECLSPKSPKSPKSGGLGDSLTGRLGLPPFGQSNTSLSVLTNPVHLCGPVTAPAGERVLEQASGSENIMSPPPPVVQVQSPSVEVCSSRSQTDAEDCVSFRQSSQRSFFSPSSSAASDCPSQSSESVIVHTTHTRTVTFSVRRFSTQDQQVEEEESPVAGEDDYDLAYKSILPVQVVWNKKPLNIIRTVRSDMSLVTVLQMTFDIEHYMAEAIHHDADWGQRYVAFCNYDLQILDVGLLYLFFFIH
ncbi:DDB1-and CUL4-associated factor [Elysia marginata]|uniref:DDB1-and CUL4-associated factor n=1 Tax=Elysia marginata TaxID=1093978 RepID=A0AAV4HH07_9GAST|nr:DDB1-and CUL4-associated factor [Elysia marginata]